MSDESDDIECRPSSPPCIEEKDCEKESTSDDASKKPSMQKSSKGKRAPVTKKKSSAAERMKPTPSSGQSSKKTSKNVSAKSQSDENRMKKRTGASSSSRGRTVPKRVQRTRRKAVVIEYKDDDESSSHEVEEPQQVSVSSSEDEGEEQDCALVRRKKRRIYMVESDQGAPLKLTRSRVLSKNEEEQADGSALVVSQADESALVVSQADEATQTDDQRHSSLSIMDALFGKEPSPVKSAVKVGEVISKEEKGSSEDGMLNVLKERLTFEASRGKVKDKRFAPKASKEKASAGDTVSVEEDKQLGETSVDDETSPSTPDTLAPPPVPSVSSSTESIGSSYYSLQSNRDEFKDARSSPVDLDAELFGF